MSHAIKEVTSGISGAAQSIFGMVRGITNPKVPNMTGPDPSAIPKPPQFSDANSAAAVAAKQLAMRQGSASTILGGANFNGYNSASRMLSGK